MVRFNLYFEVCMRINLTLYSFVTYLQADFTESIACSNIAAANSFKVGAVWFVSDH